MIRVLIVDDEPPARRKLRRFLEDVEDIEVAGEAASGRQAVEAIQDLRPQAVFLDIQMPEMDGFEVLQEVEREARAQSGLGEEVDGGGPIPPATSRADEPADQARVEEGSDGLAREGRRHSPVLSEDGCREPFMPRIVFVTAYDRFALKAFEVAALDYLLKPFDRQRLNQALGRLRRDLQQQPKLERQEGVLELLGHLRRRRRYAKRIMVRSRGRVRFLQSEEIDWIESAGNYLELHVGSKAHLLRETLSNLEERLDPQQFVRVHRSAMVNLDRVREIHPYSKNDYTIVLSSGHKVRMSRRYRDRLDQASDL